LLLKATEEEGKTAKFYSPIATTPTNPGEIVAHALAFLSIYPFTFFWAAAVNICLT
jgi:hypothetical protein